MNRRPADPMRLIRLLFASAQVLCVLLIAVSWDVSKPRLSGWQVVGGTACFAAYSILLAWEVHVVYAFKKRTPEVR